MAVVIDTALKLVFEELLKLVVTQTMQSDKIKTQLKRLETTLKRIEPIFFEGRRLSKVLDRPEEQTKLFMFHLEKGKELVVNCSRIKFWNVFQKIVYSNKLIRLNNELLWFFQIELEGNMMSTSMRSLIGIYDLSAKLDKVLSAVTTHALANRHLCRVPRLPEHVVGFNVHLQELKRRLLNYDTEVLVVSGPGGCGKTTLAKMLCHDNEIKVFGENILYVTVSRQSSFKIIINNIFEHYGKNHCEFQTDEEARNQLENLINGMGPSNMLLVLDDVWAESESIIQDLMFQTPGYKVLVTSRFLFPRFTSTYVLGLLNDEDARTLLCNFAFPSDGIPNVTDDLVNKTVRLCMGLPLALSVVGASLCGQPVLKWKTTLKKRSESGSILESNSGMLLSLKSSVDALDELPIVKECFLDLGSFPEDKRISAMVLIDMWVELYNLDDEGMYTSENLLELSLRNLINLVPIRKYASELDGYCNQLYVTQHGLLRELVIHMSSQEPVVERKRLFIEIHRNEFPTWWLAHKEQLINARILSISTDEAFYSNWYDLHAPKVEVLALNIRSKDYTLPEFIKRMGQLKVLIVTSYSDYLSQLHNLSFIECLSNLRTIRFEHVALSTIQPIFAIKNLRKVSFFMCEIGDALMSCFTESPYIKSNITDLEFDMCYDMKELPSGLCNLVHLRKLSITNCQELDVLPKGLESLSNLEILRLHCCTKLQELPESVGSLCNLSVIDISDCLSISVLPKEIGELCGLRVLKMDGCSGLQELPRSISKLSQLEDVICDEETSYSWMEFEGVIRNLKIHVVEEDRFESFMKIVK
ncbi:putative powdery mildew resistance protein, RPW8 [Helianthus debilis subsp. tardiflorus]